MVCGQSGDTVRPCARRARADLAAVGAAGGHARSSAYQLHLDAEFGTIECGKAADFTVLEDNPLTVDPMAIKDIGVWGTVVGGVPHEGARG